MLKERDAAREIRDFETADRILDDLADLDVSLDDARRQRAWWVGQRADGKGLADRRAEGKGQGKGTGSRGRGATPSRSRERGAASSRSRRDWYRGYE